VEKEKRGEGLLGEGKRIGGGGLRPRMEKKGTKWRQRKKNSKGLA